MSDSSATVSFGSGTPRVNATVRLTGRTHIQCCTYPDRPPILSVTDGPVSVAMTVAAGDQQVTGEDVAMARELADAVAEYVAGLEQLAGAPGEAGKDSAADPAA